eukprot:TRINITY_DN12561_c0_g1_i2.p1 TRINITY_DN12561_c0_g1~~TRINITY_DN12561_c0_g1_i2.p1  ORF type:complete len:1215 (+),score=244.27 TRINITY_DN12561_c0_g1_i2:239-3646(+)
MDGYLSYLEMMLMLKKDFSTTEIEEDEDDDDLVVSSTEAVQQQERQAQRLKTLLRQTSVGGTEHEHCLPMFEEELEQLQEQWLKDQVKLEEEFLREQDKEDRELYIVGEEAADERLEKRGMVPNPKLDRDADTLTWNFSIHRQPRGFKWFGHTNLITDVRTWSWAACPVQPSVIPFGPYREGEREELLASNSNSQESPTTLDKPFEIDGDAPEPPTAAPTWNGFDFTAPLTAPQSGAGGLFGATSIDGFGNATTQSLEDQLWGSPPSMSVSGSLFGNKQPAAAGFGQPAFGGGKGVSSFGHAQPASGGLLGQPTFGSGSGSLFGNPQPATGGLGQPAPGSGSLFGNPQPATGGFGQLAPGSESLPAFSIGDRQQQGATSAQGHPSIWDSAKREWNCAACYTQNDAGATVCAACQAARPAGVNPGAGKDAKPSVVTGTFRKPIWAKQGRIFKPDIEWGDTQMRTYVADDGAIVLPIRSAAPLQEFTLHMAVLFDALHQGKQNQLLLQFMKEGDDVAGELYLDNQGRFSLLDASEGANSSESSENPALRTERDESSGSQPVSVEDFFEVHLPGLLEKQLQPMEGIVEMIIEEFVEISYDRFNRGDVSTTKIYLDSAAAKLEPETTHLKAVARQSIAGFGRVIEAAAESFSLALGEPIATEESMNRSSAVAPDMPILMKAAQLSVISVRLHLPDLLDDDAMVCMTVFVDGKQAHAFTAAELAKAVEQKRPIINTKKTAMEKKPAKTLMAKTLDELASKARGQDSASWAFTLDKYMAVLGSEVINTSPCAAGKYVKLVQLAMHAQSDQDIDKAAKAIHFFLQDREKAEAVPFVQYCPQKHNPFHTCSSYCQKNYGHLKAPLVSSSAQNAATPSSRSQRPTFNRKKSSKPAAFSGTSSSFGSPTFGASTPSPGTSAAKGFQFKSSSADASPSGFGSSSAAFGFGSSTGRQASTSGGFKFESSKSGGGSLPSWSSIGASKTESVSAVATTTSFASSKPGPIGLSPSPTKAGGFKFGGARSPGLAESSKPSPAKASPSQPGDVKFGGARTAAVGSEAKHVDTFAGVVPPSGSANVQEARSEEQQDGEAPESSAAEAVTEAAKDEQVSATNAGSGVGGQDSDSQAQAVFKPKVDLSALKFSFK